ncbi:MAG: hypothetical protein QGI34_11265, partial [Candidatus Latescibacteria bacterium]|nr:hypothetical protein [Candidatus Latescibacterota bacterium]
MSEHTNESAEPSNEPVNGLANEPTSEPMAFPQRVINIFFSPGQVFQSLREHPSFIPPMIVVMHGMGGSGANTIQAWVERLGKEFVILCP